MWAYKSFYVKRVRTLQVHSVVLAVCWWWHWRALRSTAYRWRVFGACNGAYLCYCAPKGQLITFVELIWPRCGIQAACRLPLPMPLPMLAPISAPRKPSSGKGACGESTKTINQFTESVSKPRATSRRRCKSSLRRKRNQPKVLPDPHHYLDEVRVRL